MTGQPTVTQPPDDDGPSVARQSGGINVEGGSVSAGGDVVGRDKIVDQRTIIQGDVIVGGDDARVIRSRAAESLDDIASLQRLLQAAQENLALIEERKAQYVLSTDIPLQLIKEERSLRKKIAWLERRIAERKPINVLRQATKLMALGVAAALTGEPDAALLKRLLSQASLLPHSKYLDMPLLEQSADQMMQPIVEVRKLLDAYMIDPNEGERDAIRRHAAPLAETLLRVYRLSPGEWTGMSLANDEG
jgi:hypothetical protein